MENKDRFFGLHFDFHADNETEIGTRTNPEDIEWYIQEARPDFIQCDCKGHPGNSSYPTRVGKAADGLVSDNLRVWCDTAKKHGLPIYVHYSGVIDDEYTKSHPEDAAMDENGNRLNSISLFGNYVDNLLIPQLKELISEYGIDGAWIDGDCWAVRRDFSDNAKPYLREGMTKEEHNKLMREAFIKYLNHYVDELHKFAPNFKITSNWAYTSYIPEKPTTDIDFISGDFQPFDSVHNARYESRCIVAQNKPWDLMAWGFESNYDCHRTEKSAVQLCQEAAMVLSQGGGFQVYNCQNMDGSAKKSKSTRMRELGDFVHERRINFGKKPVSQLGIFYSASDFYKKGDIFSAAGSTDTLIGMINCILDAQFTLNVILEYQIDSIKNYDAVIIPEWEYVNDDLKDKLLDYVKNGGNILVAGSKICMQLGKRLGLDFGDIEPGADKYIMDDSGEFMRVNSDFIDLKSGEEYLYSANDLRDTDKPAYRIEKYGKGFLAFVPFDLGKWYRSARAYILSDYIKKVILRIAVKPVIEINRRNIDLTMQETGDGMLINLINMHQGRHSLDYVVYNEIPPIHNVEVIINKPCRKVSMPLGENFECEHGNGFVKISLEKLYIHSIIKLEE